MDLSAQISRLQKDSLLDGVSLDWIEPQEIEEPYRGLLFHERDMTSTLAAFHGEAIGLTVLQERQVEGAYLREVLLSAGEKPVEYGLIEVLLENFEESLQARILSGKEPLGGILNESGLGYRSRPQGFLRIRREDFAPDFFPSLGGNFLFGRYNALLDARDRVLARILEILPLEKL